MHMKENNFKPVLESIQELTQSDVPMPKWLQEVFLGYGDPSSAHYKNMPNRPKELDYRDTFIDWSHLVESFPGKVIRPPPDARESIPPPYILSSGSAQQLPVKAPKKRRRDVQEPSVDENAIDVRTYKLPNMGPYPVDRPRTNHIKFTNAQGKVVSNYIINTIIFLTRNS